MNIITLIVWFSMAILVAAQAPFKRCADIKPGTIDFQKMKEYSPFYIYLTTVGEYNCSTVSYLGPAPSATSYTGTSIVINGAKVYSYDITLVDNTVFNARQCSDGAPTSYTVLYSNLNSANNASFCVYYCDDSGDKIGMLACCGRDLQSKAFIGNYLRNLTVPITGPVYNSQLDCKKPGSCVAFT